NGLPSAFKVNVRTDRSGQWLESSILHLVEEAASGRDNLLPCPVTSFYLSHKSLLNFPLQAHSIAYYPEIQASIVFHRLSHLCVHPVNSDLVDNGRTERGAARN